MWTMRDGAVASYLSDVYGISKAESYGARSHSGSLGLIDDAGYDMAMSRYKKKRRQQVATAVAVSGGLSGGLTYGLNRSAKHGLRGKKLRKTTLGMAALGAAIPAVASVPGVIRQNQLLRSPEGRARAEMYAADKIRLQRMQAAAARRSAKQVGA